MPSVKVCLWNIRDYGQVAPKYDGSGYIVGNSLRNQFIARFVKRKNIDVLLIQECTKSAEVSVDDLARKINALYPGGQRDWCYSVCGSTIVSNAVDEATSAADVGWKSGGRTEGYAVLWRSNQAARFTMVDRVHLIASYTGPHTADVNSPLNMSQCGRPVGNIETNSWGNFYGGLGGFKPPDLYPTEFDEDRDEYFELDEWPQLKYPPAGGSGPNQLQWATARRPVYVVLKLGGDATNLCPVAVYHAPSNQGLATWGAYMAGLSRELYVTNTVTGDVPNAGLRGVNKCVFGGDFNCAVAENDWPDDYLYFAGAFSSTYKGGANCTEAPSHTAIADDRCTTVQIQNRTGPINSGREDAYLKYMIDLVFVRGGVTAARIDLLSEIRHDFLSAYDTPIKGAYTVMRDAEKSVKGLGLNGQMTDSGPQEWRWSKHKGKWEWAWVPIISGAWGGTFLNWDESCAQFGAANITDYRRAAEYYHLFISDHLPLVATIPV
ncbi:MAG TPA: hypothetical protein VGO49_02910 [Bradyrhizobium sp.]|jgi:hypothetical protein|nr:hypothetical protein [Bradyrhizobium sp.]